MADTRKARTAFVARILEGEARATTARRRAAFDNADLPGPIGALLEKATRQYDAAMAALDTAMNTTGRGHAPQGS